MRKMVAACALAVAVVAGQAGASATELSGAPGASASAAKRATLTVNQGDMLKGPDVDCTIGYVDAAARRSITAAHCGKTGDRVSVVTADGATFEDVGTLHLSPAYLEAAAVNDFAYVQWDEGVVMGTNLYSGDTRLSVKDVGPGDTLCFHGMATHTGTKKQTCGAYRDRLGNNVVWYVYPGPRNGDSGGPVWIPGKGFLGITTNTLTFPLDDKGLHSVEVATVPEEGPPFNIFTAGLVGGQALSSKYSSEAPYDASREQASSNRLGEEISRRIEGGSSHDFAAELSFADQSIIYAVMGVAAAVGLMAIVDRVEQAAFPGTFAQWIAQALQRIAAFPGSSELLP